MKSTILLLAFCLAFSLSFAQTNVKQVFSLQEVTRLLLKPLPEIQVFIKEKRSDFVEQESKSGMYNYQRKGTFMRININVNEAGLTNVIVWDEPTVSIAFIAKELKAAGFLQIYGSEGDGSAWQNNNGIRFVVFPSRMSDPNLMLLAITVMNQQISNGAGNDIIKKQDNISSKNDQADMKSNRFDENSNNATSRSAVSILFDVSGWSLGSRPSVSDSFGENGEITFKVNVNEEGEIVNVKILRATVSSSVVEIYQKAVQKLRLRPKGGQTPPTSTGTVKFIIASRT